jgi:multimeric flavodoxin WrbA
MSKTLVIFGSSANEGNTFKAIHMVVAGQQDIEIVNLNQIDISPFDYDQKNSSDDFLPLAQKMVEAKQIIIATPIYWYHVSAIMKVFLDRISDLLVFKKDLGRKLRNKDIFVIASYSNHPHGKKGFERNLKQVFEYLGMNYCGAFLCYNGSSDAELKSSNPRRAKYFSHKVFGK